MSGWGCSTEDVSVAARERGKSKCCSKEEKKASNERGWSIACWYSRFKEGHGWDEEMGGLADLTPWELE